MAITHDLKFNAAPDTSDGDILGPSAASKVGFYGTSPVVQQVVPATSPTIAQLITALVASGLIAQHD